MRFFNETKPKISILTAVAVGIGLLPFPALGQEVLEYSRSGGGIFPSGPVIVSSFTLPIIAASTVRLLAGVFTLYMGAMIFYGMILQQHNCGNVDKCKLARGVYKTGLHGFVLSLVIVSFGGYLVMKTFSLVGLA
jgi:hypothetical protein